ncbi:hypothetical protein MC885_005177 [Smutsia gigantea]|nr:hypothetical protein MC885_005177 [Smutsia gigantea]
MADDNDIEAVRKAPHKVDTRQVGATYVPRGPANVTKHLRPAPSSGRTTGRRGCHHAAATLSPETRGRRDRGGEALGAGGRAARKPEGRRAREQSICFSGVAQEPGGPGTARAGSARNPAEFEPKAKGAGTPLPRSPRSRPQGGRHAPPSRRAAAL